MDDIEDAIDYLDDYARRLKKVHMAEDIWNQLLPWQHHQHFQASTPHGLRGQHVQRVISRELQKMSAEHSVELPDTWQRKWLRYDHLPTTAVGGFQGLVVVAANPSYAKKNNDKEMNWRRTEEGNTVFCRDLFTEHAAHANDIGWWVRVARFAHRVMKGTEAPNEGRGSPRLWQWAAEGQVGVVDLIPFHSQSDELTGVVGLGGNRTGLLHSLYGASRETLGMALRLKPKAILVTSRSGAFIAEKIAADVGAKKDGELKVNFEHPVGFSDKEWPRSHSWTLRRYRVDHFDGNKTLLYTMPGQLFSTRAGLQAMQLPLAELIHKEL